MSTEEVVANLVKKIENRYYGKYRGFVKSNTDPEKLGRLKVTVPSVLGGKVAVWAYPCVPFGGNENQGFLFIPEKNAGVWVEFEEGDPEFPIWVGTFWSKPGGESELPKPNDADGSEQGAVQDKPTCKIIKTKKGHTIQMEDADGKEMVTIVEAKNKHVVTMDKKGIKITDGANEHEIVMNNDGVKLYDNVNNHKLTLASGGVKIVDRAGGNEIEMSNGGITIKSDAVTIDSSAIKLGAGAAQAMVLGTQFNTLVTTFIGALNSHTHTSTKPGDPTSPPASAMTLNVPLSANHKVE